jgi:hypothetical protein
MKKSFLVGLIEWHESSGAFMKQGSPRRHFNEVVSQGNLSSPQHGDLHKTPSKWR